MSRYPNGRQVKFIEWKKQIHIFCGSCKYTQLNINYTTNKLTILLYQMLFC